MLTPEQMAEYITERKALAALRHEVTPQYVSKGRYRPVSALDDIWDRLRQVMDDRQLERSYSSPILALAAAHDALGMTIEECPVVAAYREALVEETARRMWAEDRLGEASEWSYEWSEVYDKEFWRTQAAADIAMKE